MFPRSAALIEEGEKVRADRAGVENVGWVCWSFGTAWSLDAGAGRRLSFPKQKQLDVGVSVLGAGVLPMYARRRDGWTLNASGTPITIDAADVAWLVGALGGTWQDVKVKASA